MSSIHCAAALTDLPSSGGSWTGLHLYVISMHVNEALHDLLLVRGQFLDGRFPAPPHFALCSPQICSSALNGQGTARQQNPTGKHGSAGAHAKS